MFMLPRRGTPRSRVTPAAAFLRSNKKNGDKIAAVGVPLLVEGRKSAWKKINQQNWKWNMEKFLGKTSETMGLKVQRTEPDSVIVISAWNHPEKSIYRTIIPRICPEIHPDS